MGAHVRTSVHGPIMNSSNAFAQRADVPEGFRTQSWIHCAILIQSRRDGCNPLRSLSKKSSAVSSKLSWCLPAAC
jgi:hypothetical protein